MTTQNERTAKRRARRIAADEAHSWARNLRLGNPHAKLVLCMLTQYVNGAGVCWVSIPQLSEDCELAINTVRNRLTWLEDVGAINRLPRYIDEYGRRTDKRGGKRTTDDIVLLIDAEIDRSEGENDADEGDNSGEISPPPGGGLTSRETTVSPPAALQQPSSSVQGLTSESEPESPLKSPPGTKEDAPQGDEESEPEHFGPAWGAWPGHEVMRRDLALAEFRLLSPDKQLLARAAVPLFAQLQVRLGRTRVPNFHLWLRSRGFEEFPNAKLVDPSRPVRFWFDEAEVAGLAIAMRMAERGSPRVVDDPERGRGLWRAAPCEPDLRALFCFVDEDPAGWQLVEHGTAQFAAWRDRLALWLGGEIAGEKIWLEDYDPQVHGVSAMDPAFRLRKSIRGLRVPAPWPPHRDGSWPQEKSDDSEVA